MCKELLGKEPWKTISCNQVKLFELSNDSKDGPSVRRFRLQLKGEERMTPWNKQAAAVFSEEFSSRFGFKHVKKIESAFFTHLITLKRRYHEAKHPTPAGLKKKEAKENAAEARRRRVSILTTISIRID